MAGSSVTFCGSKRKIKWTPSPLRLLQRERDGKNVTCMKQTLIGERVSVAQSFYKRDLLGHFGCVNSIEFSHDGELFASGGDDRRLLVWNIGRTIFDDKAPLSIETLHISNINSCCFDITNSKVATGGNDGQVIMHDIDVRQSTAVYGLSDAVYCMSPDPLNASVLATASDDGKAQIIDTRVPTDIAPFVLADSGSSMHSVMYNPVDPRLLATANSKHGIALWDIRMPLKSLRYKSNIQNCMSVRFNCRGDRLLALRRRASPVLYDIAKMHPVYEFDYRTYYNACTLKSGCFAGLQDEYVMSGSDDFCIYLWKIPTDVSASYTQSEPHMILKGHRSIVNQVRYCHHNQLILSSGVEKLIKMWSPYSVPGCTGRLQHSRRYGDDDELERNAYSHEEYIHMVLQAGSFLSHDYTDGNMAEEPCMIAFFDSLIQREVEQNVDESEGSSSSSNENKEDEDNEDNIPQGEGMGMPRIDSEAPLWGNSSGSNQSPPINTDLSSLRRDTAGSVSSRNDESSRPFYMDVETSSESDSEVEEILSAMYSRYMDSRARAIDSNHRPSGRKISSVIAKAKMKDNSDRVRPSCRKVQRIREDLQHSGDQFLRDNARNMSILADVIDNFVDNLVASESNSRTLSDTNDGHMSNDSPSSNGMQRTSSSPSDVVAELMFNSETSSSQAHAAQTSLAEVSAVPTPTSSQVELSSGMYFMPELQAFAPGSYQRVLSRISETAATTTTSLVHGSSVGVSSVVTTGVNTIFSNSFHSVMQDCPSSSLFSGLNNRSICGPSPSSGVSRTAHQLPPPAPVSKVSSPRTSFHVNTDTNSSTSVNHLGKNCASSSGSISKELKGELVRSKSQLDKGPKNDAGTSTLTFKPPVSGSSRPTALLTAQSNPNNPTQWLCDIAHLTSSSSSTLAYNSSSSLSSSSSSSLSPTPLTSPLTSISQKQSPASLVPLHRPSGGSVVMGKNVFTNRRPYDITGESDPCHARETQPAIKFKKTRKVRERTFRRRIEDSCSSSEEDFL